MVNLNKVYFVRFCAVTACSLFVATMAQAQGSTSLKYNTKPGAENGLGYKVLKLALEKIDNKYTLVPADVTYPNTKAETEAVASGSLDIMWRGAKNRDDPKFTYLPFPIDAGLLGYRLFLIDGAKQGDHEKAVKS